jgi:hypothetical protein
MTCAADIAQQVRRRQQLCSLCACSLCVLAQYAALAAEPATGVATHTHTLSLTQSTWCADGWGPWTSSRGSTWSAETGQPHKPFEYSSEHSRGFTAPRFVRDASRLEYEKKYSPLEFRVRRFAIAGVILGGVYTLWSWAYGGGITRRRLTTVSRQPSGSGRLTPPTQPVYPSATAPVMVAAAAAAASGATAAGLASVAASEGSRQHAASQKAAGDTMRANGDFAGAAKAYREAALSAGVDKMFVEGRVGRLSEGGTEYRARLELQQREQSAAAAAAVGDGGPADTASAAAGDAHEAAERGSGSQQPAGGTTGAAAATAAAPTAAVNAAGIAAAAVTATAAASIVAASGEKAAQQQQVPAAAAAAAAAAGAAEDDDGGPPMRGRARSGGLAGYKDSGERTYSRSHTKGTSAGRPGTVTAKGLQSHVSATARGHSEQTEHDAHSF